jgi:RNA-directed DNA polymerase
MAAGKPEPRLGGVHSQTLAEIEQYGEERMLDELSAALRSGTCRPRPVLRRYIPKADGRQRPLGIPTVRDRVAQMAATLVLEPIFETDFRPSSYGFRPRRSATQALEVLRVHAARGGNHVLDADIRDNYFGSIDHAKLLVLVERRISDRARTEAATAVACGRGDGRGPVGSDDRRCAASTTFAGREI